MGWKNKSGVDKDSILGKIMSLFKKDDDWKPRNWRGWVSPALSEYEPPENDKVGAYKKLRDIQKMRSPETRYGPENIFPEDIETLANILYNIEGGQKPGRYKFSGGKGEVINPSDPQKLIAMVADVFSQYPGTPGTYRENLGYDADKYGRPGLTGKSFGATDVQDIVELISASHVIEDSDTLDTILQLIQPRTKGWERELVHHGTTK